MEKAGFLASITQHIRDVMYEYGVMKQSDLEQEVLRRLGMISDVQKHNTVKRRIYDALSTFLALNILVKQDKTLYWKGFPGSDGMHISASPSVQPNANEDDESSQIQSGDFGITEEYLRSATQEELQQKIEEINLDISNIEQKISFHDFFLSRPTNECEQKVNIPFCICASRESRNSVVLPKGEGGKLNRFGLIFPKDAVTMVTHDQIIAALIDAEQFD